MINPNRKIEELLKDKTFHNWVHESNQIDVDYWNSYLAAHPDEVELLEEASMMIKGIPVVEDKLPVEIVNRFWNDLDYRIKTKETTIYNKRKSFHILLSVAATLTLVTIVGVWYYVGIRENSVSYATKSGEKKEIILPDNSKVILSSNSSLTYKEPSDKSSPRKVTLKGEAFFSVISNAGLQKFIVSTSDDFQVEVLGTEFNVKNRENQTSVVLFSGKIKLKVRVPDKVPDIEPGEMVVFEEKSRRITRKKVNSDLFYPVKNNNLIVENITIAEIIHIIEDIYDIKVQLEDPDLKDKRFTGTFETDKLDVLLDALSNKFNLLYTRKENIVLLKPFKQNF